ncbi:adenylate cyclase-associated protein [Scheffersomyces xylosifermentans]|uniref:adenylate cyclase-associated protein n=1 Tax=Scheffersomyces xylosifermentans TaxID=1304137 RepID=UPI00315DAF21
MSGEESQFNLQGYNIVTILKRLEAATSRLEDITIFQTEASSTNATTPIQAGDASRGIAPVAVSGIEPSPASAPAPVTKPKSVVAFEEFISSHVTPFVTSSESIDPIVGQVAKLLEGALNAQVKFLSIVAASKKPDVNGPAFLQVLTPINEKIGEIISLKDANRRSEYFNHLNTVGEGAPVLGWIVTETPLSYIPEFKDSAKFWSDRVLKEFKEKDPKHVEWVKQFLNIFDELKAYVKEYHTTGPSWNNANGKSFEEAVKDQSSEASTPTSSGAPLPPPPPPPPPANLFDEKSASTTESSGGMNAVFASLNQGENITAGLKKVDKSEMTHKNPALREHGVVPAAKKPSPPKKPSSLSSSTGSIKKKVPKKELVDGTKWIIQNYTSSDVSDGAPLVIEVDMQQSVFIGNCDGITVQLKGKANAVSISETRNTGVVVDSLISGVDIIKSYKFGLQVIGVVPLISVDKSDEGSIYLSKESLEADAQIFTSSTTALNINVPTDDDFAELAAPEQFRHTIKNGKLISEVLEHKD